MNFDEINKLWDRFLDSGLAEMEIELDGTRLRLKKSEANPVIVAAKEVEQDDKPAKASAPAKKSASKCIKAPLVGTFYAAPSPDSAPFVKVGDYIKKGDVIGIIEAMKLMNEVTATEEGTVAEIFALDGSFVEFDQELISLK